MPVIDPILNQDRLLKMRLVEFTEFLTRIAFECDRTALKSEHSSELSTVLEGMHVKIERLLIKIANASNI